MKTLLRKEWKGGRREREDGEMMEGLDGRWQEVLEEELINQQAN